MTWRFIPREQWFRVQIVTLTVTAFLGASIAATPVERNVSTLTVIESTMSAAYWAYGLIVFSVAAFAAEVDMKLRKHERWVKFTAVCHILLCALMASYAAAALWGVLFRIWWNFGAPSMAFLLAYLHRGFVRRPPNA